MIFPIVAGCCFVGIIVLVFVVGIYMVPIQKGDEPRKSVYFNPNEDVCSETIYSSYAVGRIREKGFGYQKAQGTGSTGKH